MSLIEKRICNKHGLTDFVLRPSEKRWRCKKCCNEAVIKRRQVLKKKAVEYKGGKCEICGYNKCIDALEFHHLDPTEKEYGIGGDGSTKSFERLKKELDKCICVCANCHREIHFNNRKN